MGAEASIAAAPDPADQYLRDFTECERNNIAFRFRQALRIARRGKVIGADEEGDGARIDGRSFADHNAFLLRELNDGFTDLCLLNAATASAAPGRHTRSSSAGVTRQAPMVTRRAFVLTIHQLTRAASLHTRARATFIFGRLRLRSLVSFIHDLLRDVFPTEIGDRDRLAEYLLTAATPSLAYVADEDTVRIKARESYFIAAAKRAGGVTCDEFVEWWARVGEIGELVGACVTAAFVTSSGPTGVDGPPPATHLCPPLRADERSQILSPEDAFVLSYHLPEECRRRARDGAKLAAATAGSPHASASAGDPVWRLLFATHTHGRGFHALVERLSSAAATLVVVRDTQGHVFGAFAATRWEKRAGFAGSHGNWLFTLRPHVRVYRATGLNENWMYLNWGQQTLPNGIGFGGQVGFFGLWVDADGGGVEHGHSRGAPNSSTYGNPQLCGAGDGDFVVDELEVWCVRELERDVWDIDTGGDPNKRSVLDTHADSVAMLEMTNRKMYSKEVREPGMD